MNSPLLSPSRGWLAWLPLGSNRKRAAVLLGAAESIRKRAGTPLPPQERVDLDRVTDAAVTALGREAFTGVPERGRRMSIEEAAGYALSGETVG
jgi:hypothetical protein